ncbi:APC family permease [Chloroflexota bacterium]
MTNAESQDSGVKLKRDVSFIVLIAAMVGLNIGSSLFVLTGIAAGLTGPSLFIAQIIAAVPILLALVPYMTLTSAMPMTCANYQYAKLFSVPLAAAAWMVLFIAIPLGAFSLFAIATAKLLSIMIPGLPIMITAIGVLTLFYVINVLGIKLATNLQFALVLILILALLVFIVPGIPAIDSKNLTPLFTGGVMGLIGASALIYTLLAGALFGIEISGEVKNARVSVPRALFISMLFAVVVYILVEVVAVGVMDWRLFAKETLGAPAQVFLVNPWLGFFIIGGGIMASITTINLIFTMAGRYALVFARDGFFPSVFGRLNRKFGTPHWGLTLPWGMTTVLLLTMLFFNISPPLETLGAMLNFGLLFMITLVLFAGFRLPKKHPEIYAKSTFKFSPRLMAVTSLTAAIINIIFMIILAMVLQWAFLLFIAAGIAGVVVYFARKRQITFAPSISTIEQAEQEFPGIIP